MKTLFKLFVALLLSSALIEAAVFQQSLNGGGVNAVLSADKPLTTGNNLLHVSIKEPQFQDAKVVVKVFMPEMPGMPRMEMQSDAKPSGHGIFNAQINFSMSGTWQVWIMITPKVGQKIRIKSSVNI